jgi:transposase
MTEEKRGHIPSLDAGYQMPKNSVVPIDPLSGVVEANGTYFAPNRRKGHMGPRRKGRATNKQPVFGIYERRGKVYSEIVPDCRMKTLQQIIR